MRASIFLLIIALLAGLQACNTSGCTDLGSAIPLAGFYDSSTGEAVTLDSLRISGVDAPLDSPLCVPGRPVESIYLPVPPEASSVTWRIEYKNALLDSLGVRDFITMEYEHIPYFASEECGAMYYYRLRSLTHTDALIDSVTVTDSLFTNADRQTIHIYFRIEHDDEEDAGEGGAE